MTLPRLHLLTDGATFRRPDFDARLAALSTLGPRLAVHVRDRTADGRTLHAAARRIAALVRPSGVMLVVNARPDIAAAVQADGVQLRKDDLGVADARRVATGARIGRSVHGVLEAGEAIDEGADWIVVGTIYESASHPGLRPAGPGRVRSVAAFGKPTIAIGGVRPDRAPELHEAGAWGVAVISALWDAQHPLEVAHALLAPWGTA